MSGLAEHLKEIVLHLPIDERAELAHCLLDSLEKNETEIEPSWKEELERRWREIESGEVVGKPIEEVFAELRKKFP